MHPRKATATAPRSVDRRSSVKSALATHRERRQSDAISPRAASINDAREGKARGRMATRLFGTFARIAGE